VKAFHLSATVSTDGPAAIRPHLERFLGPKAKIGRTEGGFRVAATLVGESARDLNRQLVSEMRRVRKKTRLRAEWTADGVTEKFFDYVPKGTQKETMLKNARPKAEARKQRGEPQGPAPIHDVSHFRSVSEWYRANLGRVPAVMAGALAKTMDEKALTFPEAYALLVGRGAIIEIAPASDAAPTHDDAGPGRPKKRKR
jgi:hypothetical protein